jgi:hypothetical protein
MLQIDALIVILSFYYFSIIITSYSQSLIPLILRSHTTPLLAA